MSRDGYIINRAYRQMYSMDSVNMEYMHVSRRSMYLPALSEIESPKELFGYVSMGRKFFISAFF